MVLYGDKVSQFNMNEFKFVTMNGKYFGGHTVDRKMYHISAIAPIATRRYVISNVSRKSDEDLWQPCFSLK